MRSGFCTRVASAFIILLFATLNVWAREDKPALTGEEILARTAESTVLILTGEGAGRLNGIASGVIVRADGVILTAYHVVKDAREVQIRLKNGDIYDSAELLGFDGRRDVAALKITGHDLPVLAIGMGLQITAGEPAYAVTNSNGLSWSATQGIFSGVRFADEIAGAGVGYRVLQFTSPIAPGASGGPVVDCKGALVGIITKGMPQGTSFAVPIENVIGLSEGMQHVALGNGVALQLPKQNSTLSSKALANANPKEIIRSAKTVVVRSRTMFFTADSLDRALSHEKSFSKLDILLVNDPRLADLVIEIDRPLFTYQFTFSLLDPKTSIVLASGKVTAFDGETASELISKEITKRLLKSRQSTAGASNSAKS